MVPHSNFILIAVSICALTFSSHLYLQSCRSYSARNVYESIKRLSFMSKEKKWYVANNLSKRYVENFVPDKSNLFGPIMHTNRVNFIPLFMKNESDWKSLSRGLKYTVQIRDWEHKYNTMKKGSTRSGIGTKPNVYVTGEYSLFENACFLNSGRLQLLWPINDANYKFTYSATQAKFAHSESYQHNQLPLHELGVVDSAVIFNYSDRSVKRDWSKTSKSINVPGTIHHWLLPYDSPNCWHGFFDHLLPQFRTLLYLMKNSASLNIFPFDAWLLTQGKPSPENYFIAYGPCYQFLATVLRGFLTFLSEYAGSSNWSEIPFPALYFGDNETTVSEQVLCFDRLVYRGSGHNTTPTFTTAETMLYPKFRQRLFQFLGYSSFPSFPHRAESIPVTRYRRGTPIRIVVHDRLDSGRRRWRNADELIQSIEPQLIKNGTIHLRYLPSMGTTLSAWEQIGVHLTCDLLVSVHGANLMLTMFMPENSSVIQVAYPQYAYPFMGESYSNTSIAGTFSLHQYGIPAISLFPSAAGSSDPNSLDLVVPPKLILQKIKDILGIDIERKWNSI